MENLYSILGVDKNASEQEIKKAYRKKSLENHPDRVASKSKAEQEAAANRMQDINKAYEILSDAKKKDIYDLTGSIENAERGDAGNPFGGFSGGGGFDFSDLGNIFGDFFGRGSRGGGRQQGRPIEPGQDMQLRVKIGIEELWNPKEHRLKIKRDTRCPVCHGSGGDTKTCPHCNGTGMITDVQRQGFAVVQQTRPCPHCNGTGQIVTKKCTNKDCNNGFVKSEFEKIVMFPEGVQDGQYIVYQNEGNESHSPQGINGRLIVIAQYDFDKTVYNVDGANVTERLEVNYEDCILGKKITHMLPSGNEISLTIPALTPPNKKFLLRGKGLHVRDQYGQEIVGNYIIEVVYRLPEKISEDERFALEDIRDLRK